MKELRILIQKYWPFISYLIFGGLTTLINLIIFYELYTWHHLIGYQWATFIAWLFSVLFAYVTNKEFVFNSHQKSKTAVLRELESFFFFRMEKCINSICYLFFFFFTHCIFIIHNSSTSH